jgi:hypothetical protein
MKTRLALLTAADGRGPSFGAGRGLFVNGALDNALSWRLSHGGPAGTGTVNNALPA